MNNMKKVTVIIPIHKFDETIKSLLSNAIESVDTESQNLIFVGPKNVLDEASKLTDSAELVYNEDVDVYTQINKAVLQCTTQYFTILEFDDELLRNWTKVMESETYDNSIILPIDEYIKDGEFVGFGNEIMWDAAFVHQDGELGVVTKDELEGYKDFNVTGGLIKTEDFISVGQLKPEYKVVAWYEFLNRILKNGKKIVVVPRVCYKHTVMRDDSYLSQVNKITTPEEVAELLKKVSED